MSTPRVTRSWDLPPAASTTTASTYWSRLHVLEQSYSFPHDFQDTQRHLLFLPRAFLQFQNPSSDCPTQNMCRLGFQLDSVFWCAKFLNDHKSFYSQFAFPKMPYAKCVILALRGRAGGLLCRTSLGSAWDLSRAWGLFLLTMHEGWVQSPGPHTHTHSKT